MRYCNYVALPYHICNTASPRLPLYHLTTLPLTTPAHAYVTNSNVVWDRQH